MKRTDIYIFPDQFHSSQTRLTRQQPPSCLSSRMSHFRQSFITSYSPAHSLFTLVHRMKPLQLCSIEDVNKFHGHTGTQTRGYTDIRTRGYTDTRGHMDTRTQGHADTRTHVDTWTRGHKDTNAAARIERRLKIS